MLKCAMFIDATMPTNDAYVARDHRATRAVQSCQNFKLAESFVSRRLRDPTMIVERRASASEFAVGFEPSAARRLRRVVARTSDHSLRATIEPLLMDVPNTSFDVPVRAERTAWSPPAGWRAEPLGDAPAAPAIQTNLPLDDARLGGDLPNLTRDLSGADMAELLVVLAQQATALKLVWEAHVRGALTLPDSLERRVEQARHRVPRFLAPPR